jgi:hypothetical protein
MLTPVRLEELKPEHRSMAVKLSSRQVAKLAVLETFPPKFDAIYRLIEELGSLRADESVPRRLSRMTDEMKAGAQAVGATGVAETLGVMAMLARRTGGVQTRVRGLREAYVSLRTNFEGAVKNASTPGAEADLDEHLPV